jgi:hypothetical protein
MIQYKVTPTDPRNTTAVAATEALLKKQYGDADVHMISDENSFPTWLISSTQDIFASLELVDGVQHVTKDIHAAITRGERVGAPEYELLFATRWNILAADGSDLKKTEAFLNSQIEPDTEFFEIGFEGSARGWGNVTLTNAAKAAVEKHEGVADIVSAGELRLLRALPVSDTSQDFPLRIRGEDLISRDTTWQNQSPADKSLIMDSQYRYVTSKTLSISLLSTDQRRRPRQTEQLCSRAKPRQRHLCIRDRWWRADICYECRCLSSSVKCLILMCNNNSRMTSQNSTPKMAECYKHHC